MGEILQKGMENFSHIQIHPAWRRVCNFSTGTPVYIGEFLLRGAQNYSHIQGECASHQHHLVHYPLSLTKEVPLFAFFPTNSPNFSLQSSFIARSAPFFHVCIETSWLQGVNLSLTWHLAVGGKKQRFLLFSQSESHYHLFDQLKSKVQKSG